MRNKLLAVLLTVPLLGVSTGVLAQSPVGTWTTIDDETGRPKSVVEIYRAGDGSLAGRVNEVLQSEQGPDPVCDQCPGERRDQPVEGMEILWGISRNGEVWDGGKILDPASGKIYSVRLKPIEAGSKLEVRGFIGFSLLGRTQTWVRQ
ncbi:DUF2147 domain-containing protein [Lysobacter sp. D1-1-M9]|uniref:DUF2147 domain-containing protein n=1 Tax=Novilysobacter longmucuonensis TaxID=3098603 RepID=UPI002FC9BD84